MEMVERYIAKAATEEKEEEVEDLAEECSSLKLQISPLAFVVVPIDCYTEIGIFDSNEIYAVVAIV